MTKVTTLPGSLMGIAVLISATMARAEVFTDRVAFDAANPGLPVLDFEDIAPPFDWVFDPDLSSYGVAFDAGPGNPSLIVAVDSVGFGSPTDILGQAQDDMPLRTVFLDPVQAVGFDMGLYPWSAPVIVEAFNGTELLESLSISPADTTTMGTFRGFSGLGDITSVMITPPNDPTDGVIYLAFIDNLAFGVPEPSSLMLLGIGVLAAWRRR